MITSTVSTVDGVTTTTWTNNFGYQVMQAITADSNGSITRSYSEYRTEVTEENNGHVLMPGEGNYQYTSISVYDGVDAYVLNPYYLGEMISYTRIREYDNGIVHTDVHSDHGPDSSHPTQSDTSLHTETNAAGVVILEILRVSDSNGGLPTKTFTYYDNSGILIETIVQAPVINVTINSQSIDYIRTHYDANDVITGQTYVIQLLNSAEGYAYYDSLGLNANHSLDIPYNTDWGSILYIEIDSSGNILSQSTGT